MKAKPGVPITAAHIAVAVVAACGITGADAATVFEDRRGHVKTRLIAAAGLMARLEVPPRDAARLLQVERKRLSPSMLEPAGVTTDALLTVAEALESHGLTPTLAKRSAPKAEAAPPAPQPQAQGSSKRRKAATPAPAAKRADPPPAPPPTKPEPPKPKAAERRPVPVTPERRPRPAPATNPVRPTAPRPASGGAVRLKPINDRIVGWCRPFVARGMAVEDLADLFDVHPDALRDHLKPELARAA